MNFRVWLLYCFTFIFSAGCASDVFNFSPEKDYRMYEYVPGKYIKTSRCNGTGEVEIRSYNTLLTQGCRRDLNDLRRAAWALNIFLEEFKKKQSLSYVEKLRLQLEQEPKTWRTDFVSAQTGQKSQHRKMNQKPKI